MEMQDILRILQAGDSTSPASDTKPLTESANDLHKISHPVRMAMQHYSPVDQLTPTVKESKFKKFYHQVEEEIVQEQVAKKQRLNQYAQVIAEKVSGHIVKKKTMSESTDSIDTVTVDIPLLIRLLEYSREDAKTDMDLHNVAEQMIALSKQNKVLSMEHYDAIVGEQKALPSPDENNNEQKHF